MDQTVDTVLGFAPDHDVPIPYMRRTREYYAAIGYSTPYRWAHYLDAPFAPFAKPLNQSTLAVVTTVGGVVGPGSGRNFAFVENALLDRQQLVRARRHEHDVHKSLLDDLLDGLAKLGKACRCRSSAPCASGERPGAPMASAMSASLASARMKSLQPRGSA